MEKELYNETVQLIKQLVSIKSTAKRPQQLEQCVQLICNFFRKEKVHVQKFKHNGIPSVYIGTNQSLSSKILLCSHFDVFAAPSYLFEAQVKGNLLYGRGVYDDKGPLALLMVALRTIARKGNKNIALITTGDEEIGSLNGMKLRYKI